MSVLDFFGKCPRETETERKETGGAGKKRSQTFQTKFTRPGLTREPRKCDSAVWVPGFPMYDCAFLCRERSLSRKLNHVSAQAHMVVSTSTEEKQTREPQLTRLQEPDRAGEELARALKLEEPLMKTPPNPSISLTAH